MLQPVERPNIYCETLGPDQFGIIEKPLTVAERIYNQVWLRKTVILIVLALRQWAFPNRTCPSCSALNRSLVPFAAPKYCSRCGTRLPPEL